MNTKKIIFLSSVALREPFYSFNKLNKLLTYHYNPLKKAPLKNIVLYLTLNCDLQCIMCPLWKDKNKTKFKSKEISVATVKQIIKETKNYFPSFLLTGGEPLLVKNWTKIAELIKKNNLHCNLQTNGTLLQKYAKEVVNLIDFLNVSLDGTEKIHNTVRQRNSFNDVINGLKAVNYYKLKLKKPNPYINICFTINERNYFNAVTTLKYLEQNTPFINEITFTQEEPFEFTNNITNSLAKKMTEEFLNLQKQKSKFILSFRPETKNKKIIHNFYKFKNSVRKNDFRKCPLPFYEIYVFPDGSIFSCPSEEIGNFTKENFTTIIKKLNNKHKSFLNSKENICLNCQGEIFMYNLAVNQGLNERKVNET